MHISVTTMATDSAVTTLSIATTFTVMCTSHLRTNASNQEPQICWHVDFQVETAVFQYVHINSDLSQLTPALKEEKFGGFILSFVA